MLLYDNLFVGNCWGRSSSRGEFSHGAYFAFNTNRQFSAYMKSIASYHTILEINGILTESPLLDVQTRLWVEAILSNILCLWRLCNIAILVDICLAVLYWLTYTTFLIIWLNQNGNQISCKHKLISLLGTLSYIWFLGWRKGSLQINMIDVVSFRVWWAWIYDASALTKNKKIILFNFTFLRINLVFIEVI